MKHPIIRISVEIRHSPARLDIIDGRWHVIPDAMSIKSAARHALQSAADEIERRLGESEAPPV